MLNADIQTVDVQKTSKDYAVPMNVFDRLVEIEVDGQGNSKIVPSLAKDWDISGDGLEYTFHLRDDVKFQNGNDFTAEDVLYTFERLLTVEGGVNTELLDQVKGAADCIIIFPCIGSQGQPDNSMQEPDFLLACLFPQQFPEVWFHRFPLAGSDR